MTVEPNRRSHPPEEIVSDIRGYPANLCLFFCGVEFTDLEDNFGEAVSETIEEAPGGSVREGATEHFDDVLSRLERVEDSCRVSTGRNSAGCWRGWDKVSRVGPSQMILPLQVGLGDLQVIAGSYLGFCGRAA